MRGWASTSKRSSTRCGCAAGSGTRVLPTHLLPLLWLLPGHASPCPASPAAHLLSSCCSFPLFQVGKKLPRAQNQTDTSFKSRTISLVSPREALERHNEASTEHWEGFNWVVAVIGKAQRACPASCLLRDVAHRNQINPRPLQLLRVFSHRVSLQAQQSVAVDREGQAVSTRNLTLKASSCSSLCQCVFIVFTRNSQPRQPQAGCSGHVRESAGALKLMMLIHLMHTLPRQCALLRSSSTHARSGFLPLQELLGQCGHYSERVRKDALQGLGQLLAAHPGVCWACLLMRCCKVWSSCRQRVPVWRTRQLPNIVPAAAPAGYILPPTSERYHQTAVQRSCGGMPPL